MSLNILIITCEHGGNQIPLEYSSLFKGSEDLLESHRGYDPGAFELAEEISHYFSSPFFFSKTSRLLIDLNRSLHSRSLFSSLTKTVSKNKKEEIIEKFYLPYRLEVKNAITDLIEEGKSIFHLSVHSFTPILKSITRRADIGLLYDSQRLREKTFCKKWQKFLKEKNDHFLVRLNYPYLGRSDGFAPYLRTLYDPEKYMGIELEVNQKFPLKHSSEWALIKRAVIESLSKVKG